MESAGGQDRQAPEVERVTMRQSKELATRRTLNPELERLTGLEETKERGKLNPLRTCEV